MLTYYKLQPTVHDPVKATSGSACFDIHAWIPKDEYIVIGPGVTKLIPTGLIFDIPLFHSIRIHPRSGLAVKSGLMLANCEGIIDSDYVEPVFVPLHNISLEKATIHHGDRICQAELVENCQYTMKELKIRPGQKTERSGGFGSTGINQLVTDEEVNSPITLSENGGTSD